LNTAFNNISIQQYFNSTIFQLQQYFNPTIFQFNNISIQQYINSTIFQFNNVSIQQYINSKIHQFNNTSIQQFNKSMQTKKTLVLIACIIGCIVIGSLPSVISTDALRTWYPNISKPSWNPPNYLFGPVWSILFTMMGIALWQIIYSEHALRKHALTVFVIQFALNLIWTILFFAMQSPGLAFIEIIIFWMSILYTIILFMRIKKSAGLLLVPYACWVGFAAVLNCTIWWLNKG
jgi:translocator protein